MSKSVTLENPIKRGDQVITEISLRKPLAGELRGLSLIDVLNMQFNALQKLLPRITTPTLTEIEVAQLDVADLTQLSVEVTGFFLTKAAKEESSQPV